MASKASKALLDLVVTEDFERAAQESLPAASWEYIAGGEEDTIARNREAFGAWLLRPRVLRDVSWVDLGCELFGRRCGTPIYLSSLAKGRLVAKEGEVTFMRAAERMKSCFIVPTIHSAPLEEVWKVARHPPCFQVYVLSEHDACVLPRLEALRRGVSALLVTVDANAPRHGALHRATAGATGVFPSPSFTWQQLEELRGGFPKGVRVYLKGVQSAADALEAARRGFQGLVVSNHGGRACGGALSALEALEEVAPALRDAGYLGEGQDFEVYFDSGVRSGRDVLKALCLGAKGVGLGRPYYWASACHGEEGIVKLLEQLNNELRLAMAQLGCNSLAQLGPDCLRKKASRL